VAVADQLPDAVGAAVLAVAQTAFVDGMRVATTISAILAVGLAVLAVAMLRNATTGASPER
jgi:hypothetical protein